VEKTAVRVLITREEREQLAELSERTCIPLTALIRPLLRQLIEPPPAKKPRRQAGGR